MQVSEKSHKTNANQNTKFHQLQRMFGKQTGDTEPVPLYKQINQGDVFSTEHEVSTKCVLRPALKANSSVFVEFLLNELMGSSSFHQF